MAQNPWSVMISLLLAVTSFLLNVFFYFRGKREKKPCVAIRSINILRDFSSKFESLELSHLGEKIENLTVTKILFWNGGRETILALDIPEAAPLCISTKEERRILDAKIIQVKNPANKFCISITDQGSSAHLYFDYVDKDEGCVIQLMHTGRSSQDINITGKIKGAGSPIIKFKPESPLSIFFEPARGKRFFKSRYQFLRWYFSSIFFALIIFCIMMIREIFREGPAFYSFLWFLFAFIIGFFSLYVIRSLRVIPREFEAFEEDFC